jgi:uncharacterized protein YfaS (alpha-2-macroglobulin family)
LRTDADPRLDAVVITASGDAVADAPVHVVVQEVGDDGEAKPEVLAQCDLRAGTSAACPFRPTHSGRYRFRASSPDAADAQVDRYAYIGNTFFQNEKKSRATLSMADDTVAAGTVANVLLRQPFAKANVLFTVEHGEVLDHWILAVDAAETKVAVPIKPAWSPGVTIHAAIVDAADKAFGKNAALGSLVETASADIAISGGPRAQALSLSVEPARTAPGSDVTVALKNTSATRAQVTLAVVDDAARALVPDIAAAMDPTSSEWLGGLDAWNVPAWYALGAWPRSVGVRSGAAPSVFDFAGRSQSLETIVVTGSNIPAASLFVRGNASDHSLARAMNGTVQGADALRRRFAESALWKTDIVLEAGQENSVAVHLPDNLTRWRALAWSADTRDGFSLAQQTIEASLPLEVRSDVPARLFPGDSVVIAANVHNHDATTRAVDMTLAANGSGVAAGSTAKASIGPNAQQTIALDAQPNGVGQISVEARAHTETAKDGVAASVEVESPVIHERVPVAGWLPSDGVHLKMPMLPPEARHVSIRVDVGRGLMPLAIAWIDALRDYPHRCWEQILSRAVGAAAAKRMGLADAHWKDADGVVADALRASRQFQDESGQFYFFAGTYDAEVFRPSPYLTAYTLQSFNFLRSLGYDVPADVEQKARKGLEDFVRDPDPAFGLRLRSEEERAHAMAAILPDAVVTPRALDHVWDVRSTLSWQARARLADALANDDANAGRVAQFFEELRAAGKQQGMQRVLMNGNGDASPFASRALDQCAAIDVMRNSDHADDAARVRTEFMRGLADLYAGGAPVVDTQSSAQCLMMLANALPAQDNASVEARIIAGAMTGAIELNTSQNSGEWHSAFDRLPATLDLRASASEKALISFVANVEYDLDGRHARSDAVGFSLSRRYSVLRGHAWNDVSPTAAIHAGDWVRVTLHIATKDPRRFVAISDTVAGGLQPTDLELAGVSDLELARLATPGSPYFHERQVDERHARFYAEQLPPGAHDVVYYARAAHAGRFAALPATAELMYGRSSVARTDAAVVAIGKDAP